ncbi:MAG: cadherin-like beta sandwich domain-containing protein [Paludibacter sp.]
MRKTLLTRLTATALGIALAISGLVAQTLKHSYTFEDGTWSGTTLYDQVSTSPINGTINGNDWEIKKGYFYNHNSNQSATNQGGYISFEGIALALNTYSSVIMEAYLTTSNDQNNPNKWSVLAYFGGAAGANSFMLQPEISGSNTKAGLNNVKFAVGAEAAANQTHHYVAVLTPAKGKSDTYPAGKAGSVKLYYDGALIQSTALDTATYKTAVSALATTSAQLGKGAWTDALFTQPIHEFNIYDGGVADSVTVNSFVASRYSVMNGKLTRITLDAGTLSPVFDGNIYNYGIVIPAGTTSLTIGATAASTNYPSIMGAGVYDVAGDYGTITLKTSATSTPYSIYWRKAISTAVLAHSYPFTDGTAKDIVGTDNGVMSGSGTMAGGLFTTTSGNSFYSGNSQHISLPASSLNFQNYPSASFEVVGKTATSAANFWCFFGNQTIGGNNSATGGVGTDYAFLHTKDMNISCNINHQPWNLNSTYPGTALNDNKVHHVVGIITMDSLILYQDGVLKGKAPLSNVNRLFNISSKVAYIGRSGYPGDANFIGSIGEFNIWKGQLANATVASRATLYLKDATLSGITVSAGTLAFDPATTTYNVTIPSGITTVIVEAIATKDFATVTGTGTVTIDGSGNGIANLLVTSADGTTIKTYTVNFGLQSVTAVDPKQPEMKNFAALNSARGKLMIQSDTAVTVYNSQGMKIAERAASKSAFEIALTPGVYVVKSAVKIQKVIVQ